MTATSLWSIYETWRQIETMELLIPGSVVRVDWSRAGMSALFGIIIPITFILMNWRRAFPPRAKQADS